MSWALVSPLRRARIARRTPVAPAPQPAIAPAAPTPTGAPTRVPTLRDWLGILAMVVGLFMAIMDVQIVTSSLTQIQGGLSASADEIAWVQTSYLIADVVMVPLSGMMSRLLSTRVLFVTAALGFTGASVLCAVAESRFTTTSPSPTPPPENPMPKRTSMRPAVASTGRPAGHGGSAAISVDW